MPPPDELPEDEVSDERLLEELLLEELLVADPLLLCAPVEDSFVPEPSAVEDDSARLAVPASLAEPDPADSAVAAARLSVR